MNRKLKNSLTALSAGTLLLVAAILAGSPAGPALTDTPLAVAEGGSDKGGSSHSNANRRGLALPYFSFARGVRRIGG